MASGQMNNPTGVIIVKGELLQRLLALDFIKEVDLEVSEAGNAGIAVGILDPGDDIRSTFIYVNMPSSMDGLNLRRSGSP